MIYLVKNGPQYPEKVPKTSHCLAMLYFLREDGVKVTVNVFSAGIFLDPPYGGIPPNQNGVPR